MARARGGEPAKRVTGRAPLRLAVVVYFVGLASLGCDAFLPVPTDDGDGVVDWHDDRPSADLTYT